MNLQQHARAMATGAGLPPLFLKQDVIAFVGERGAGKDTACEALWIYDFKTHAFADGLRAVCREVFGITDKEMADRVLKESPLGRGKWAEQPVRWFMKIVGTECFRDNFPGVWIERLWRVAERVRRVAIPDCRFWDEFESIKARGGIVVRIDNPNVPVSTDTHRSEIEWREFPADYVLVNDFGSAEEFMQHVLEWYAKLPARD